MLSGEAVAIDAQPLGVFMRTLGALIDVAATFALILAAVYVRSLLANAMPWSMALDRVLLIVLLVLMLVIVPVTVETVTRGRSLGKLAVGGRVLRVDGGAIGFRHAFIRALVGVLEIYMTFGSVALLTGVFTPRSQRLGDLMAGTYSQRMRTKPVIVTTPPVPPQLYDWASVADVARMPDRLARRISQFLESAASLTPASRERVATTLMNEAAAYVSPQPPAPPEVALIAISAVRREREMRGLAIGDARAERLSHRRLGIGA